ncbi:signal peptidase II [Rubrivivax gelatinosus]|uniref:Lipoprotein signal peptidase n=1 Tax=Rubrivivax gelatinosus (strain NBRC 100245 / IL144) TaxID=983917 RepID=I0HP04_RUBGI|nr:signal peptidase II [Rubrivivax gelatinosus]MBG6081349.1 signal peptidase II [Rubrivivax gelatinosus]BAL94741.1 lipoprotein signal peptidase LspA [Rubrivivax gelatinosus IL144]
MATSSRSSNRLPFWLGLAFIVVVLDQFTKTLILGYFQDGEARVVTGFFNIVRVHNSGAAFSFLADAAGWQRWFFVIVGVIASAIIVWMLANHTTQRLFSFAVTMILGGAVGNVIDRLLHGHVIDFLQFRFGFLEPMFRGGYFPSFNLADAAITLGAVCLVLDEILRVRRGGK